MIQNQDWPGFTNLQQSLNLRVKELVARACYSLKATVEIKTSQGLD